MENTERRGEPVAGFFISSDDGSRRLENIETRAEPVSGNDLLRGVALGGPAASWLLGGPAGDSPGSKQAPPRDPYAPRGPLPPDPPPENPYPPGREVWNPLVRVCLYLGTIFILLNVFGILGLVLYNAVLHPGSGMEGVAELASNLGIGQLLALYVVSAPFAIGWTVLFRRKFQARSISSLGLHRRRWLPRSAAGYAVGVASPGLILLLGTLVGVYEPRFSTVPVNYLVLVGLCLGFVIQGGTEELIFRGYAQKNMVEWRGDKRSVGWILVFPSLVFAIAHSANPDYGAVAAANTFLLGFALGAAVLAHGDLWAAIGFHSGWNFAVGIWSLPVSGMSGPGLLEIATPEASPEWAGLLFGGSYGPEGGLVVTFLAVLAISVLLPRAMDAWPKDHWGADER